MVAPRLARVVATIHATFRFQLARESHVSPQDPSERPYEQFEDARWAIYHLDKERPTNAL